MSGEPYMPLYLGDLLAATLDWTGEERALYVLLLAFQWFSGPLSSDPKRLAKVAQYDEETFIRLWSKVHAKFVLSSDGTGLINLKCEEHRARVHRISSTRAEVGAIGGKRTQARRREMKESTQPAQSTRSDAVPCACETASPAGAASMHQLEAGAIGTSRVHQSGQLVEATSEANRKANGEANKPANGKLQSNPIQSKPNQSKQEKQESAPTIDGLDLTAWERFVAYRRDIRKPLKPASVEAAQRQLVKFGKDQAAVVEQSIANGWQGLFALKDTDGASTSTQSAKRAAIDEAWQRVVAHVRSGAYRSHALGDARIDEAVRQIGGYSSIGMSNERELPFIARKFAATFAVLS